MTLDALMTWGLETGLMVSFLILIVLIIRRPFARYFGAGAAYALWLLPFSRLFMPQMTVPFLRKSAPTSQPIIASEISEGAPQIYEYSPPVIPTDIPVAENLNLWPILTALWLGMAVLWLGFQLFKQTVFIRRMRQLSEAAPLTLNDVISSAKVATHLRKTPEIRLSEHVTGPMVTGVLRPLILLPHDFETRFNPEQQAFALLHEMVHIKRRDLWVAFAALITRALFWPNPLIHYAAHKLRIDQEAACDAMVLARSNSDSDPHAYAETLLHAAKLSRRSSHHSPLGLALTEDTPVFKETEHG